MSIDVTPPAGKLARAKIGKGNHQFGAHRNCNFGSGGRRWRAPIGGKIDQGDIGLVTDSGDKRNHACGCRPYNDLFVEWPQVLEGAAPAAAMVRAGRCNGPARGKTLNRTNGFGNSVEPGSTLTLH